MRADRERSCAAAAQVGGDDAALSLKGCGRGETGNRARLRTW